MKKTFIQVLTLSTLIFTACGENTPIDTDIDTSAIETVDTNTIIQESVEQIESTTVTDAQIAHYEELLDLTSLEACISDCFITECFLYNDATFITVDFVSYKLDEDSKHSDYEIYDLVNEIKTLRTFAVNETYLDCAHDQTVTLADLIEMNNSETDLVFSLEAEDGIVTELYIDVCSG
jgi:hypothetical protein